MHLRNLRVFCDVVHRRSFSRAAEDNEMTQSGVSQAVQQLEEYLKVQLIDRSKRPFVLTAEGDQFHRGLVQLLRQFDTLTEEVRSLGNQLSGRVTIAAIYSVGLSYWPQLQRLVKERFPQAEFRYQFGHPDEVYRLVEQGAVDFGLISYPESSKTIAVTDWCQERMLLAAPPGHRLSKHESVQPQELQDENLVAFAPNLRIRQEIDRYLRHLGVSMQVVAEFDNIDSVKHALEFNSAVSFLPQPTVKEQLDSGSMVEIHCPWLKLSRPLGVIQRRDTPLGPTARGIVELVLSEDFQSGQSRPQPEASPAEIKNVPASRDIPHPNQDSRHIA
ncbi:MAG: LysR family transcriptional regulator [Pirellulaceae bacterium]|nr:LysR family transcriptional regulator [Pirellulaceae bacterium]